MKHLIYPVVALFWILTADHVSAGQTMTLNQCLETGINRNPSLMAARFSLEGAGHDIKAARADFLPSLSSEYSTSRILNEFAKGPSDENYINQDVHSFAIRLTQILYAGSRISGAYQKAGLLEQLAQAEMNQKKLELIYNIKTTFFKLMRARQDVVIVTESIARLTASIKVAEAFFEKELIPYVEVLRARVDLSEAKEQLEMAKNNLNREQVMLFSLMDLPMDPDMEFIDHHYDTVAEDPSFDSSLAYAIKNRPDIKALEYQLDIIKKQETITMGKYLPMVKADIGYHDQNTDYDTMGASLYGSYDRDQRNGYWTAGISVSWNLFDGGRTWYEKEKYRSEARKINALITETQNLIATGIRKAMYSMAEAKQRIANSDETLAAANEYYSQEESRLKAGISTIPDLLDAQGRLIRAQGNQNRAFLDYQLAKSEFKLMTGDQDL